MSSDQRSMFWLAVLAVGLPVTGSGWPIYHAAGLPAAHVLGWGTFIVGAMAAVAGVAGLVVLAREHELTFGWRPRVRMPSLRWPITFASGQAAEPMPQWVSAVIEADGNDLTRVIHQMGVTQYGNVAFNLDDEHKPSVTVSLQLVNASIYTLVFEAINGPLQVEFKEVSGGWQFTPFEVAHNRAFLLKLRWIIETDASINTLKKTTSTGKSVCVSLDAVRVLIYAKEHPGVNGELRFSQQTWIPRASDIQPPEPRRTVKLGPGTVVSQPTPDTGARPNE